MPAVDRMQEDHESLERRNASEVDKLVAMLKANPEEALRYAIPVGDGTGRGGPGQFQLSRRWSSFTPFGSSGHGGAGRAAIISEFQQERLIQEYTRTAESLISRGEYEKAAFVYLKLLKRYHSAAHTLALGGLYPEAAAIHLQFTKDKAAAADCYLKAKMLSNAIELYTEIGKHELAGDLYLKLNRSDEAMASYQLVVDDYVNEGQFLPAAKLTGGKMGRVPAAQELLLQGWRRGKDAVSCLHTYLNNIPDEAVRLTAIHRIYEHETDERNETNLLAVLKKEADRDKAFPAAIRSIAIRIIAFRAQKDPSVIPELRFFSKEDTLIPKDILRHRISKRG